MAQERSLDRRKIKTKAAIREAFISLIKEKGFKTLLVSDITEWAKIHRGTFYLHYQDKFDLMDKAQTEIIENIQRIIVQANTLDLTTLNDIEKPLPVIVSIFEYLKENANLVHAVFSHEGGRPFQSRIRKTIERNLKPEFLEGLAEKNFMVPGNYLLSYAIPAHFGVIQDWLDRGCIETPGEMALIVSKISWFGVVRSAGFEQT
jgi:AcrR family transcriptional regulator